MQWGKIVLFNLIKEVLNLPLGKIYDLDFERMGKMIFRNAIPCRSCKSLKIRRKPRNLWIVFIGDANKNISFLLSSFPVKRFKLNSGSVRCNPPFRFIFLKQKEVKIKLLSEIVFILNGKHNHVFRFFTLSYIFTHVCFSMSCKKNGFKNFWPHDNQSIFVQSSIFWTNRQIITKHNAFIKISRKLTHRKKQIFSTIC